MTTIVLLHGFSGAPTSWDEVRRSLEVDAPILTPAIAGHAHAPTPIGFEAEVDRLAGELEASGARGAHVCGYSMGGRLALGLVVRHPELASHLTLIGASPGLDADEERAARRASDETWAVLIEKEGLEAFARKWQALPMFATQAHVDTAALARQHATRLRHSPEGLAAAMRHLGVASMPSYWAALPDVQLRVRVVAGALDGKFVGIGRRMVDLLPHATFTTVANAGHNIPLENPHALGALIAESPLAEGRGRT